MRPLCLCLKTLPILRSWPSIHLSSLFFAALTIAFCNPTSTAQDPESKLPAYALKDLDGHFPFQVPETKEEWEKRAEELRMQIRVSQGIWPMPTLAAINPVIHSRREMDGYAVEKVYFESLPGFFVTGSLYVPTEKKSDKMPAVLCPHGHWNNGRFYMTNDNTSNHDLAVGAERFESGAQSPLQARCVHLARMGCLVFHYDMIGYADSVQIGMDRAHEFGLKGPNPKVDDGKWLLFSPEAEGHLQSVMGLQTINSIQAFEFVYNRPDVDKTKISITGASGGGTQTFILTAIEPRLAGAYPVVMVSAAMQGGCTCENASGLRVDTGNVEIAALCAPRPLAVNSADDWTKNMAKDGYPQLQQLYDLYGAKDQVSFYPATHFGHNYNHVTRVTMYGFMNRLFGLGLKEPVLEREFTVLQPDEMTVWDTAHPQPKSGIGFESELLKAWTQDVATKLAKSPADRIAGWKVLLAPAERIAKSLKIAPSGSTSDSGYEIRNVEGRVVGTVTRPKNAKDTSIKQLRVVSGSKSNSPSDESSWTIHVQDAWNIDLNHQQSLVANPRPAASYTYGYNSPLLLRKLAIALAFADSQTGLSKGVNVSGEDADAFLAAALKLSRPNFVGQVDLKPNKFSFDQITSIRDVNFLPGALRYGGLDGLKE